MALNIIYVVNDKKFDKFEIIENVKKGVRLTEQQIIDNHTKDNNIF